MSLLKDRSERNRTISLTEEEKLIYLSRCINETDISTNCDMSNSIVNGDCINVLPYVPKQSVDLLIVDPPYNLSKKYSTKTFNKMDDTDYAAFTRAWIEGALHTLKSTASIYICSDWVSSLIIGPIISEYFIIQNRITWEREKGRGSKTNWKNSMEDVWFATVSNEYTFNVEDVKLRKKVIAPYRINGNPKDWEETINGNYRDTHPSNFWDDISIPYWSMPENTDHPTQKPEKLYAKLVLASTNTDDLILDPFAGVGTSSVVAKKLGRNFIGIEIEPEFCALAEKRLDIATAKPEIQGYTDGVFWERNTLAEQKKASKSTSTPVLSSALVR
ncbi:MAG: site-specific DNA-methyltransferase [Oscillospiraceae bacterium]|nr:site-specific DNA-methyltransferase [Oscillospiraceae bacterium]